MVIFREIKIEIKKMCDEINRKKYTFEVINKKKFNDEIEYSHSYKLINC